MLSDLTFRNGSITGVLAGVPLQVFVNPTQPGCVPAAGDYHIEAPVNDPVFGPIAVLVPKNQPGQSTGLAAAVVRRLPLGTAEAVATIARKQTVSPLSRSIASMTKQERPGSSGSTFVISGSVIPGMNCLQVTLGFAALISGLQQTGGAEITIS